MKRKNLINRGRVLLVQARVVEGELAEARRLLALVDQDYLDEGVYRDAVGDQELAEAMACVIEAFGLFLAAFKRKAPQA